MDNFKTFGNLGKDPVLKETRTGTQVAEFSLAEKLYGDKTNWHNCVCFGKTAETAAGYLKKGSKILIQGNQVNSTFTKKNGSTGYKSQIEVSRFAFLGSKKDPNNISYQTPDGVQQAPKLNEDDLDDLF